MAGAKRFVTAQFALDHRLKRLSDCFGIVCGHRLFQLFYLIRAAIHG